MHCLSKDEVCRFGRQLILPEIGVPGQERLKKAKVLIVGAGGLGCPVAIYLAAAGVGQLGIVDYDCVDKSNLHRQILHTEDRVGTPKVDSICSAVQKLNSDVDCVSFKTQLSKDNALEIVSRFDIVADCTDNVATRYLLNDACVLCAKPLVSGSALRWEGQLTVYNFGRNCPCYRCLFPKPPPAETVTNCSEGGVMGPVPGIIGTMQALEIIKIAAGLKCSYSQKMFLFDGLECHSRTVKLRERNVGCEVCGDNPSVKQLIDYDVFCGSGACDKIKAVSLLADCDRISVGEYKAAAEADSEHVLVDTRPQHEFQICRIHKSLNIPMNSIINEDGETLYREIRKNTHQNSTLSKVFVVCRRGNDSQTAVITLREKLEQVLAGKEEKIVIKDLIGGLESWATHVDHNFPLY